jgi:hypothetical protein
VEDTTLMLEQEIVAALEADVNSSDLSALIERTEVAISKADQAAETARTKALDPALSPDPKTARAAMEDAVFIRDRLHGLKPRLQQRLQQVEAAEAHARWLAVYERVSTMVEESARRFAKYPELIDELISLFQDAEAVDKEVARVNGSAPPGEHRRLRQVELVARGLDNFSRADPPITKAVQLADWMHSDRLVWPPPQPSLALFAMSMVPAHNPRYTADWAAALEKDNARRAATEARWAEEEAARQAESRRAYEASLRR